MPETVLNIFAFSSFPLERNIVGYKKIQFRSTEEELRIELFMCPALYLQNSATWLSGCSCTIAIEEGDEM
jgi:hypothetical protein